MHDVMWALAAAVLSTIMFGLGFRLGLISFNPKDIEVKPLPLPKMKSFKREPFAKPNGKKSPKVNDDHAAWAKENDL